MPCKQMLLLLFWLVFTGLAIQVSAQETQLILAPLNSNYVAYFPIPFIVSTSNSSTPLVTCKVTCPNGLVSRNVSTVTTQPSPILVTTPAFFGTCVASVEAAGYLPAQQSIKVVNYTRCSTFNNPNTLNFTERANATFSGEYTKQGPLGFIQLSSYIVTSEGRNLYTGQYTAQVIKDASTLNFYQGTCTNGYTLNMSISDSGTNSLSNCSAYNTDPVSSFRPATPFYSIYGIQAAGTYYINTYISEPVIFVSGQLLSAFVQVCLAANYIVLETLTPTLVPSSSLNFTAYLGLTQSMTATVAFAVACGDNTTSATYEIGSTPQSFVISTPNAQTGSTCYLVGINSVNTQGYAGPANITLITAEPLELVLSLQQATVSAGNELAFRVYVQSNQTIPVPVTVNLFCNDALVGGSNFTASNSVQYFSVPGQAIGVCQINGTSLNTVVSNSDTVDVTVYQQLYVASSLIGWTSGSSVAVNITSPNLEENQVTLTTSCSIGSFEASINTASNSQYTIPSNINGVQCSLVTSNLPPFYLPLQTNLFNITIDPAQIEEIVRRLLFFLTDFVNLSEDKNSGPRNLQNL